MPDLPPRPYRVICESNTTQERRYLSTWYPTLEAAQAAQETYRCEDWTSVELVALGTQPGISVTGKQLLAVGGRIRKPGKRSH